MVNPYKEFKPSKNSVAVVLATSGVADVRFYLARRKSKGKTSAGKFDGYGGRWQSCDKDMYATAKRKFFEKAGVKVTRKNLHLRGIVEVFYLGNNSKKPDRVICYFTTFNYEGVLSETEKMGKPVLYSRFASPFKEMRPADEHVIQMMAPDLHKVIQGKIRYTKNEEGGVNVIPKLFYAPPTKRKA